MSTNPTQAAAPGKGLIKKILVHFSGVAFLCSGISLGLIVFCYCYEVTSRYFFNVPTEWAHDFATYLMCLMIFLAIPEITRAGSHIAITVVLDYLGEKYRYIITKVSKFLSGIICILACYISFTQNLKQFQSSIQTLGTIPIPKWWVSIFITLGLLLSGVFFLWQSLCRSTEDEEVAS